MPEPTYGAWIPVAERLPDGCVDVMAWDAWQGCQRGQYVAGFGCWAAKGVDLKAVTHWSPLPAPPASTEGIESCSTPSPSTVVPPDRETWDILCAYLAGEEHHGSEISEGRLTEILKHRIGWCRDDVRTAWYDAVARGNALIEADHERVRPIREAEAARLMAEAERRKADGGPTEPGCSS